MYTRVTICHTEVGILYVSHWIFSFWMGITAWVPGWIKHLMQRDQRSEHVMSCHVIFCIHLKHPLVITTCIPTLLTTEATAFPLLALQIWNQNPGEQVAWFLRGWQSECRVALVDQRQCFTGTNDPSSILFEARLCKMNHLALFLQSEMSHSAAGPKNSSFSHSPALSLAPTPLSLYFFLSFFLSKLRTNRKLNVSRLTRPGTKWKTNTNMISF